MLAGIRREDIDIRAGAESGSVALEGTVDVIEHLGNEQVVYLHIPGAMMPEAVKRAIFSPATTDFRVSIDNAGTLRYSSPITA